MGIKNVASKSLRGAYGLTRSLGKSIKNESISQIQKRTINVYDRGHNFDSDAAKMLAGQAIEASKLSIRAARTLNSGRHLLGQGGRYLYQKGVNRYRSNKINEYRSIYLNTEDKKVYDKYFAKYSKMRKKDLKSRFVNNPSYMFKKNRLRKSNFRKGLNIRHSFRYLKRNLKIVSNKAIYSSDNLENQVIGKVYNIAPKAVRFGGKGLRYTWKGLKWSWKFATQRLPKLAVSTVRIVAHLISTVVSFVTSMPVLIGVGVAVIPVVIVLGSIFIMSQESYAATCIQHLSVPIVTTSDKYGVIRADKSWNSNSIQYNLFNCANGCSLGVYPAEGETEFGMLKIDSYGLYYITNDGINYYLADVPSSYTNTIGELFSIETETSSFNLIVANIIESDNGLLKNGNLFDFYTNDSYSSLKDSKIKGNIKEINRYAGSSGCLYDNKITDFPTFEQDYWFEGNRYNGEFMGQCTWFAWGKLMDIYGVDFGNGGNGRNWVSYYTSPSNWTSKYWRYSSEPVPGAILSWTGYDPIRKKDNNHVAIVVAVEGDTVVVQEGNMGAYKTASEFKNKQDMINHCQTNTYTVQWLKERKNAKYAIPIWETMLELMENNR